jgi:hypothetical protein
VTNGKTRWVTPVIVAVGPPTGLAAVHDSQSRSLHQVSRMASPLAGYDPVTRSHADASEFAGCLGAARRLWGRVVRAASRRRVGWVGSGTPGVGVATLGVQRWSRQETLLHIVQWNLK